MGLPALLGALGLVFVLFGVLSLVLALFGAPTDPGWLLGNLGIGAVLLLLAAVMGVDALRERLTSGEARRAGRYGTSAILSTVLSIAIVGGLGFLATRYHLRWDWSEEKIHSLSDQSLKLLRGLEADVEAVAFVSPLDAEPVRELLGRYAYESDRFRVEFADPDERPDLVERYGVGTAQLTGGLVRVAMGDESVEVDEITEEKVTNAIVKLSRTTERVVYFLVGHNERAIEDEAGDARDGYGRAAEALRNENYRVETLLLAALGDVPEDADAVVVPGATRVLLREEHAALERYLVRGGALLVLVDPRAKTDLVDDLRSWGVEIGDDIVVDRQLALFGRATTPFAADYAPDHEITRDLRETTLFHVARSVRRGDGGKGSFEEIVFTGDASWAERDLERFFNEGRAELGPDDLRGPVSLAVAGRPHLPSLEGDPGDAAGEGDGEKREARLAVFGDSDFASNEYLEAYRNRDLFVNTVNWLIGDVEAISIRPRRARASRFQLTEAQFRRIRWLSLFVLPEAIAVLGVFTWWTRRRAPNR